MSMDKRQQLHHHKELNFIFALGPPYCLGFFGVLSDNILLEGQPLLS